MLKETADDLGLGNAYGAALGRIKGQGGEKARIGMAALMWISHSERPLKAVELCHALAVEIGSPNLNSDNVPSIGTLLTCCEGLVFMENEASTIRLIHFTLQEYLRARPELFVTAHSIMAETCLSYLTSQQIEALSTSSSPHLQGTPFLEYCSLYWGAHARRDLSDNAKLLALKLFDNCDNHISTKILLKAQKPLSRAVAFNKPCLFSSLHFASIFGIVEIVASLVRVGGCDINQEDCVGNTPLTWAASNGHERVVKILLGWCDVNPDKPDCNGQIPLICAAQNGHEGVVKILLEQGDVSPIGTNMYGRTALCCAARNGHEGVVKIILELGDVGLSKPDMCGRTPLLCAAQKGHEAVVQTLLWCGANPDKPDMCGRTPLLCAAENGHEGVVKILLERNASPSKPDMCGETPLLCSARSGYEEVVKILLRQQDVDPDKPDKKGRTPLHWAALKGREGVAELLLERGDVDPDKPDDYGQTPYRSATRHGHMGVAALLHPRRLRE